MRFVEMLRRLAELEEIDGKHVYIPIPISAKALLRGIKSEEIEELALAEQRMAVQSHG